MLFLMIGVVILALGGFLTIYFLVVSCRYWDKGFGNKKIDNDLNKYGCKILKPNTCYMDMFGSLFDFSKIEKETFRVIGSSARIEEASVTENAFTLRLRAADRIRVHTRLRLPGKVTELRGPDDSGNAVSLHDAWDDETRTLILGYSSRGKAITVTGSMQSAAGIPFPENQ